MMPRKEYSRTVQSIQASLLFCCVFVLSAGHTLAQEEIKNCSLNTSEEKQINASIAENICKVDGGMCIEDAPVQIAQSIVQEKTETASITATKTFSSPSSTPSPLAIPVSQSPKVSPKPSPSPVVTPTPKASSQPTAKPSPSLTPVPTPTPTIIPSPTPTPSPVVIAKVENSGGLDAEVLFQMINAHRQTKGLPAYEKDAKLCELAQSRGPELHDEIYGSKYIHQGFKERNLPFWITENMISKESEQVAMNWWLNSSLHRAGIESSKKYACGVCVGKSCAMLFTSWDKK